MELLSSIQGFADLGPKEVVLLSNLFLAKDFPYGFLTLEQAAVLLNMSKATAVAVFNKLIGKGLVRKQKGYITFYYPVKNFEVRRAVLVKLGILK